MTKPWRNRPKIPSAIDDGVLMPTILRRFHSLRDDIEHSHGTFCCEHTMAHGPSRDLVIPLLPARHAESRVSDHTSSRSSTYVTYVADILSLGPSRIHQSSRSRDSTNGTYSSAPRAFRQGEAEDPRGASCSCIFHLQEICKVRRLSIEQSLHLSFFLSSSLQGWMRIAYRTIRLVQTFFPFDTAGLFVDILSEPFGVEFGPAQV